MPTPNSFQPLDELARDAHFQNPEEHHFLEPGTKITEYAHGDQKYLYYLLEIPLRSVPIPSAEILTFADPLAYQTVRIYEISRQQMERALSTGEEIDLVREKPRWTGDDAIARLHSYVDTLFEET